MALLGNGNAVKGVAVGFYKVYIPVCLDPHTSRFLPSLESLYSSAAETHKEKV